jgi:hypothetical protein
VTAPGKAGDNLLDLLAAVSTAANSVGSSHLADRLDAARSRVDRPSTYVCVLGEFKQGKSTLVNALLGQSVCPVDDDIATAAVTVVSSAAEPTVTLVRIVDGVTEREGLPPAELARWATEGSDEDRPSGIERIEVGVANALLAQGLTLIDTPGVGGLSAGTTAATLAFLPYADALIVASDASSELSAAEIELLVRAAAACPEIVICQTKCDIHVAANQIGAANREHLDAAGLSLDVLPVSSAIRLLALARSDAALNDASGFPTLLRWLGAVHTKVRTTAGQRAAAEVAGAVTELAEMLGRELVAANDDREEQAILAELSAAQQQLAHLRGPAARWLTVLSDGHTDLLSRVSYRLRDRIRELMRSYDERAELLRNAQAWEELGRALQDDVAAAVVEVFTMVERGADALAQDLRELLQDEQVSGPRGSRPLIDVRALWSADQRVTGEVAGESARSRRWNTGLTVARNASSGMSMFSTLTRLMAQATGALMLMSPVGVGFGLLFGATAVGDQRRKKAMLVRQQARTAIRQYLDDVQFQTGEQLTETMRTIQRGLRDETAARLAELQQIAAASQSRIEASRKTDQATRHQRKEALEAQLDALTQWGRMAAEMST